MKLARLALGLAVLVLAVTSALALSLDIIVKTDEDMGTYSYTYVSAIYNGFDDSIGGTHEVRVYSLPENPPDIIEATASLQCTDSVIIKIYFFSEPGTWTTTTGCISTFATARTFTELAATGQKDAYATVRIP